MNAPTKNTDLVKVSIPSLAMSEDELIKVLSGSLYPGAKLESIKLVIGYCKAAHLDPMQKPVHIVPMSVKTGKKGKDGWDETEMRDVVMPGIGLYRTQASRTGECAGITEPEFGEDVNAKLGDIEITFPKSCRVTVKRLVGGHIVEFTARELWKENYATAGRGKAEPNAMWKKRPYAQLAKCAEAQALRKAFPEFGAQPTADELEGKPLDDSVVIENVAIAQPQSKSAAAQTHTEPDITTGNGSASGADTATKKDGAEDEVKPLTKGQVALILAKMESAALSMGDFNKRFGMNCEVGVKLSANRILAWVKDPANV